ncbi:MAG: TetR/AcrR family transcriptional regulator [Hyphomicrobiaceae bacterium]
MAKASIPEPAYRNRLRADVIEKASQILVQEGLEAVQARRIAAAAECSVGTLYNLFGDIDGLMLAVNAATLARLGERVVAASGDMHGVPLVERLMRLARAYMQFAVENHARWDAVFRHRLRPGKEVPQSYVDDQQRLLGVIAKALADTLDDETQRMATARTLFGAVHGIVVLALDNRLGGSLRHELDQQLERIVRLAADGLEAERQRSQPN